MHIAMYKGTHLLVKSNLAARDIPIQQAFEEFATLIAEKSSLVEPILVELENRRRTGMPVRRPPESSIDELYDLIEQDDT